MEQASPHEESNTKHVLPLPERSITLARTPEAVCARTDRHDLRLDNIRNSFDVRRSLGPPNSSEIDLLHKISLLLVSDRRLTAIARQAERLRFLGLFNTCFQDIFRNN